MALMNEYINKRMSAQDLHKELNTLIREYNNERNSYLFVYASAIGRQGLPLALDMDDYYVIDDILRDVASKKLDFYIETPGGSAETAEEICRFLRRKFDYVAFVVSGEAKSAGTILVLSGNEILMTSSGSLGPIDAQIKIGRSIVSAYDYIEWIKNKSEEAVKSGKLNPLDATMVAQINPGELSGVGHALNFAKDLVVEWLPKYKFKDWNFTETKKMEVTQKMKEKRAMEIAEELINHAKWRSHGRSIKIDDLESIGLKITRLADNPKLNEMVYKIQTVLRLLFSDTTIYKVFRTQDAGLNKQAPPIGEKPKMQTGMGIPEVMEAEIKCNRCGKSHKLYAKFLPSKPIDDEFQKRNFKKFPEDNKLRCDCGFETDLTGMRNDIEAQVGKKIIT
jgi:hypothetical protein